MRARLLRLLIWISRRDGSFYGSGPTWSPSIETVLAAHGRTPTLRWVRTGRIDDTRKTAWGLEDDLARLIGIEPPFFAKRKDRT